MQPVEKGLISGVLVLVALAAVLVYGFNQTGIYQENSWLENAQVALLFAGFVVCLVTLIKGGRADKLALGFCTFLTYSFLLRELDVETLNVPAWVVSIGSGSGRNTIGGIALLAILVIGLFNFKYYLGLVKQAFTHPLMPYLYATLACLLIADLGERAHFILHYVFIEEAFELIAYCLLLCAMLALKHRPLDNSYH